MPYRLAAPPEPWVDRPADEAWLAEALGRGPVAALVGPRGAGKRALARRVLPARYPDRPKVAVSLSGPDATLVVLHALAEACGVAQVAWADLQGDALLAAIVDLAEEAEAVVVLEGADASDARPLLAAVARYARRSRWLALAERPTALPPLPGQVRRVEALPGAMAPAPPDALSPAQRELVALVRALGRPLPAAWLAPLGVADADVAALREAGWWVREADAWAPSTRAEEERLPLAEPERWVDRLGALDAPEAHHAAVALALGARRPDAAARVLEARGSALLHHRALEALWPSLARRPERCLWRWRARAALALGDRERLAQLALPEAATREERLAWAEVLRARRALEEAASAAAALGEEAVVAG
ncbi:MAG TPA: hypothetical protein RMH80_33900, partial [Polyangiaceae bacterium LLY-WYZ-15_(1-7)]|nr:hypothetical protein [Polyangiaceae bacterium LLY-WYZ-15_(1-7)]